MCPTLAGPRADRARRELHAPGAARPVGVTEKKSVTALHSTDGESQVPGTILGTDDPHMNRAATNPSPPRAQILEKGSKVMKRNKQVIWPMEGQVLWGKVMRGVGGQKMNWGCDSLGAPGE